MAQKLFAHYLLGGKKWKEWVSHSDSFPLIYQCSFLVMFSEKPLAHPASSPGLPSSCNSCACPFSWVTLAGQDLPSWIKQLAYNLSETIACPFVSRELSTLWSLLISKGGHHFCLKAGVYRKKLPIICKPWGYILSKKRCQVEENFCHFSPPEYPFLHKMGTNPGM